MKKIAVMISVLTCLLWGCTNDDFDSSGNGHGKGSQRLIITYSAPGSTANTYATVAPEEGEDFIHSLYALFFESSSGGTGRFIEMCDLSPENGPVQGLGTVELDFASSSQLTKSTAYNILFVANLEEYLDEEIESWLIDLENKTENEVITMATTQVEGAAGGNNPDENDNTKKLNPEHLLMSASVQKEANQENVNVELLRWVARFDVVNDDVNYTLVSASIWNAYPETHIWEADFVEYKKEPITRYYGLTELENAVIGGLYAFENYVASPEQNDTRTTCLILGFVKNGETDITYHRVNINATNIGQQIKRNNAYTVKIRRVFAAGANSEMDAYTSNDFLLDIKINEWDVDDQGTLQYDGENILAVPVKTINFSQAAETKNYTIFALGEGTVEISRSELPVGIKAWLEDKELFVSAEASELQKEGYVEIRFGNLRSVINIIQKSELDSYLELSVTSIPMFPATSPASVLDQDIKVVSSGPWTATIYNGNFSFTLGSQITTTLENKESGEGFRVFTYTNNTNAKPRYSFVLITLDDDPEYTRTLVLAQNGIGGIEIIPSLSEIHFNEYGKNTTDQQLNYYEFEVESEDDNPWEVVFINGADNFELQPVGLNRFKIIAEENLTSRELSAQLRVRLVSTPTVYKTIEVRQRSHSVSLSKTTITGVPLKGAETEEIIVTSSSEWEAVITGSQGAKATFVGGTTSVSGQSGSSFKLNVEHLMDTQETDPTIIVKVSVKDAPGISTVLTVKQTPFMPRNIIVQTEYTTVGRLDVTTVANYNRYINKWGNNWRNGNNFGANGVARTGTISFPSASRDVSSSADIFVLNQYTPNTVARRQAATRWLAAADNHLLMIWGYDTSASVFTQLKNNDQSGGMLSGYTGAYVSAANGVAATTYTSVASSGVSVSENKLMAYLLKDGPFTKGTEISPQNVSFRTNAAIRGRLSSWPLTLVPLLRDAGGNVLLGVDPVNRVVFAATTEWFTTYSNAGANYTGQHAKENEQFLNNLIAWITNAAQYGADFIELFY